ncbi:hypothetical protein ScPMuIL_018306 [Solemya velum]
MENHLGTVLPADGRWTKPSHLSRSGVHFVQLSNKSWNLPVKPDAIAVDQICTSSRGAVGVPMYIIVPKTASKEIGTIIVRTAPLKRNRFQHRILSME